MTRFYMNTPEGRRLQVNECWKDINLAAEDETDALAREHLHAAKKALEIAIRLMGARDDQRKLDELRQSNALRQEEA